MDINLADLYQAATIPISAEDFKLRQSGFDAAAEELSDDRLVDCCRAYYGWSNGTTNLDWFLSAFRNDPPFTMAANKREASMLAGALLFQQLLAGNAVAGLAVVSSSVQGRRTPAVPGIDTEFFSTGLKNLAIEKASSLNYNTTFKPLGETAVTKEKILEDNTLPMIAANIVGGLTDSHNASKNAFAEIHTLLSTMANDLATAREQLAMLWWFTGGWSRQLNQSFADLGGPLAYVVSGFDLADLSRTPHGPYAAEALLARVGSAVRKSRKPITVAEIGDSASAELVSKLNISDTAGAYADICPLSAALRKSAEIGKGTSWHVVFENTARLTPSTTLSPREIALQAFYERLLLTNL